MSSFFLDEIKRLEKERQEAREIKEIDFEKKLSSKRHVLLEYLKQNQVKNYQKERPNIRKHQKNVQKMIDLIEGDVE